jgi:hypothetical protein
MDRVEELNQRLYNRNQTNTNPQMLFSPRPISIKYNDFPSVDHYNTSTVPMKPYHNYNIYDDYLPSSCISPWNGYSVTNESNLRNLNQKLSKCPNVYIPKYTNPHVVGRKEVNTHPLLNNIVKMPMQQNQPQSYNMFHNTTRAKNI